MKPRYDSIVIGAGAGGGIAAALLAESGRSVLLIDRGPHETYASAGHRDHLRNQRISTYGHNAGPDIDGNPRVAVDAQGAARTVAPHEAGYQNNAAIVGGGTFVYGGQAWRFLPKDFRMASSYGVPAGSSLTDWPFPYEEIAPWYERAEWEVGVAGDSPGSAAIWPRARDYPMPPVPRGPAGAVLQRGAEALGAPTLTPPLLINTLPRAGRAACIECGSCVGFPCPTDAKNGTQNTMVPRALATGGCELVTFATAERITTDGNGRVTGVSILTEADGRVTRHEVAASEVVVSAGAIETARLLLASRSPREPQGLGNAFGEVGRHLQGHSYPGLFGLFDHDVAIDRGPGVTIATTRWNHDNPDVIGGGMLADDFTVLPIIFWKRGLPPGTRRWGKTAKAFMRDNYRRVIQMKGPVHEIPSPDARVTLDPAVTDRLGRPVARLSGLVHPETVRTMRFMHERAIDWMQAAGATEIWGDMPPQPWLSAGQHQAGTCRMGSDPGDSVTDPLGKVWGHDNLWVCDASLHPTNGGFNPVLTVMALAFRNTAHMVAAA